MAIDFRTLKGMQIGNITNVKGISLGTSGEPSVPIWSGDNFDPSQMSYTQAEFLSAIDNGHARELPLGALITLNNEYCSTYEVIGTNHDNSGNTVDIMSHNSIHKSTYGTVTRWATSDACLWLNGDFYNAFDSSVKERSKNITSVTNRYYDGGVGAVYRDVNKVTIFSVAEVLSASVMSQYGVYFDAGILLEGTPYPAFTSYHDGSDYTDAWREPIDGRNYKWGAYNDAVWTRSNTNTRDVGYRLEDGQKTGNTQRLGKTKPTNNYWLQPIMRF